MRSALVALCLLLPSLAAADRVTVKGTVLEGTVKSISAKTVVMSTVYGKGDITIATEDVSAIETDTPFHVYKADDGTEVGRVVGISPATVTLADGAANAEVPFDEVQAAPRDAGPDGSWVARRHVESPWWSGNFDLSFAATDGTTDTTALATNLGLARERGPSRLKFSASYIRSTTKDNFATPPDTNDEQVTANRLRGWIRQEYDLTSRIFGFGSFEAEHDGVDALAYGLIPKLGAGYKLLDREGLYVAVDGGLAYVYEKYFDDTLNNYMSLAFGAESKAKLPWNDSSWYARLDYLPSLSAWTDDYRLRGETGLLVPIFEPLNFKASVIDEYNSKHADDTTANNLTTLLGLSVVY